MTRLSFIVDDREVAHAFVASVNRKVRRLRFSSSSQWEPKHVVIALHDDEPVAMADCIVTDNGEAANGGLLAKPGAGWSAISALLHLKRHVSVSQWQSTLRLPTNSTVAISRRYFDMTFDQGAWELASALAREHGERSHLAPTPILVSDAFLRDHGIPRLTLLDRSSRAQIIYVAANPQRGALVTPSGDVVGGQYLMTLAFELLSAPMRTRQHTTRFMLLAMASAHGHVIPEDAVKEIADPGEFSTFFELLRSADTSGSPSGGIFSISNHEIDLRAELFRQIGAGDFR